MNTFFKYFFIGVITITLLSCKIKERIRFNEQFGGNYSMTIDLSQFKAMAPEDKSVDFVKIKHQVDSTNNVLSAKKIPGIENAKMDFDLKKGIWSIKYDFLDIAAFNSISINQLLDSSYNKKSNINNDDMLEKFMNSRSILDYKDNVLNVSIKVDPGRPDTTANKSDLTDSKRTDTTSDGSAEMIKSFFEIKSEYFFKRVPKEVIFKNYNAEFEIDEDNKSVTIFHKIDEMMENKELIPVYRKIFIKF